MAMAWEPTTEGMTGVYIANASLKLFEQAGFCAFVGVLQREPLQHITSVYVSDVTVGACFMVLFWCCLLVSAHSGFAWVLC